MPEVTWSIVFQGTSGRTYYLTFREGSKVLETYVLAVGGERISMWEHVSFGGILPGV